MACITGVDEVCKGIIVIVSITMTITINVTITIVVRILFLLGNDVIRHRLEGLVSFKLTD